MWAGQRQGEGASRGSVDQSGGGEWRQQGWGTLAGPSHCPGVTLPSPTAVGCPWRGACSTPSWDLLPLSCWYQPSAPRGSCHLWARVPRTQLRLPPPLCTRSLRATCSPTVQLYSWGPPQAPQHPERGQAGLPTASSGPDPSTPGRLCPAAEPGARPAPARLENQVTGRAASLGLSCRAWNFPLGGWRPVGSGHPPLAPRPRAQERGRSPDRRLSRAEGWGVQGSGRRESDPEKGQPPGTPACPLPSAPSPRRSTWWWASWCSTSWCPRMASPTRSSRSGQGTPPGRRRAPGPAGSQEQGGGDPAGPGPLSS